MVNRKVVAVDVDSVVVDLSYDWWKFLEARTSTPKSFELVNTVYDFTTMYPDIRRDVALSFWKSRDLYDGRKPFAGCVEALKEFHDAGFNVTFVSHVEGDHGKSKVEFLKRHFPFMSGFMATRQKGLVRPDVAFDDRVTHLNSYLEHNPDCLTVRILTPHDQDVKETNNHFFMDVSQWKDERVIDYLIQVASRR